MGPDKKKKKKIKLMTHDEFKESLIKDFTGNKPNFELLFDNSQYPYGLGKEWEK